MQSQFLYSVTFIVYEKSVTIFKNIFWEKFLRAFIIQIKLLWISNFCIGHVHNNSISIVNSTGREVGFWDGGQKLVLDFPGEVGK